MKKKNGRQIADSAARARTYVLILMCMFLFVSGLFLAGRQHFSSIDYGIKNSQLRKQIEELEAEKRRLLLTREVSLSPSEIKKAATRVGLISTEQPEKVVAQVSSPATEKDKALPLVKSNPVITKTNVVAPASKTVVTAFQRSSKLDPVERKTLLVKRVTATVK